MPRFGQLDSSDILVGWIDISDQRDTAINTPKDGSLVRSDATFTPGTVRWDAGKGFTVLAAATPSPAQVLKTMLDMIDDERTMLMRPFLTTGQEIKYEYANKAREVRDYRLLSGAVVANLLIPLNIGATRERFAWAMAERDETGDDLEVVITRWETAMKRTALVQKIAARAQKLKRSIAAAATPAAQKKIFDDRTWPTA